LKADALPGCDEEKCRPKRYQFEGEVENRGCVGTTPKRRLNPENIRQIAIILSFAQNRGHWLRGVTKIEERKN